MCNAVLLWRAEERRNGILAWLARDMVEDPIGQPPLKKFCPTNKDVPVLEDYRQGPGWDWFTEHFKMDNNEADWPFPAKTDTLVDWARKAGMSNMTEVMETCWQWKYGVDIGVDTKKYKHTKNENNESVYTPQFAPQVMDALVSWNRKGIIIGPRVQPPENVTIIKLTCREKGPGKCR